ncbi:Hypothetical protein NGAL_HAMBI2427_23560 [Neorhizobium galegae bv. orientalis]|nr:Hypothetical protein NGAL_HAMBI2427_23560 [Neorhizobium galegae bv. orientalis]
MPPERFTAAAASVKPLPLPATKAFAIAQVARVTSRNITLKGFTRNGPDRVTFANRRGCPEI